MTEKLKRCPFCGGEAILEEDDGLYRVVCLLDNEDNVGFLEVSTCWMSDKEKVISKWNTRPVEDSKNERIKELEKRLDESIKLNYRNALASAEMNSRGANAALKALKEKDEQIRRLKEIIGKLNKP